MHSVVVHPSRRNQVSSALEFFFYSYQYNMVMVLPIFWDLVYVTDLD